MLLRQEIFDDVAKALEADPQLVKCNPGAAAHRTAMQIVSVQPSLEGDETVGDRAATTQCDSEIVDRIGSEARTHPVTFFKHALHPETKAGLPGASLDSSESWTCRQWRFLASHHFGRIGSLFLVGHPQKLFRSWV